MIHQQNATRDHIEKNNVDELNIQYLSNLVIQMNRDLAFTRGQLILILSSTRWHLAKLPFVVLEKVGLKPLADRAYRALLHLFKKDRPLISVETVGQLPPPYTVPTIYNIHPYKNLQLLKDIEVKAISEDFDPTYTQAKFSIATPVYNEASGILDFLKSVAQQTLKPDELILTDGGSTDNTVVLIEKFAKQADFRIIVIKQKRIPIATGRNLAIKKARNDIIVMADAGNILHKNYCLNMVACFKKYPKADLAGGIWLPQQRSQYVQDFIPDWKSMRWDRWLASTRAMAFRKSLAKKFNYFPEHVFYGDDTLFSMNLRRYSKLWVFNTKSISYWDGPHTQQQAQQKSRNYGFGDGENGLGEYFYPTNLTHPSKTTLPIDIAPVGKDFLEGFIEGRAHRGINDIDGRSIRGIVIVLTTIPFYEHTQSSVFRHIKSLVANNYKVICVNFYPNLRDAEKKVYIDIDYTLLELYYMTDFDVQELLTRYPRNKVRITAVQEADIPSFLPIVRELKAKKIPVSTLSKR